MKAVIVLLMVLSVVLMALNLMQVNAAGRLLIVNGYHEHVIPGNCGRF